jgi:hypothetical protein
MPSSVLQTTTTANPAEDSQAANSSGGAGENNEQNNEQNYADLWHTSTNQQDETNNQQPAGSAAAADPEKAMQLHIANLGLTKNLDFRAITNDLNSGRTESLQAAFTEMAGNVYKAAIQDAAKVAEAKARQAEDSATSRSRGDYRSDMLVADMHKQLEYTSAPGIEPIAKAVLTKFIQNGKTPNDAIKEVDRFFNHVSTKIGGQRETQGTPGSGRFYSGNLSNTEEPNWLDILGEKPGN